MQYTRQRVGPNTYCEERSLYTHTRIHTSGGFISSDRKRASGNVCTLASRSIISWLHISISDRFGWLIDSCWNFCCLFEQFESNGTGMGHEEKRRDMLSTDLTFLFLPFSRSRPSGMTLLLPVFHFARTLYLPTERGHCSVFVTSLLHASPTSLAHLSHLA